MDSLLSDIPAMIRTNRFDYALVLLQVFIHSAASIIIRLETDKQKLESELAKLTFRQESGEVIPDFAVLFESLVSATEDADSAFARIVKEYESCFPKLRNIINSLTLQYNDNADRFKTDFAKAARGMVRRVEDLSMVNIPGFLASYANVRPGESSVLRAFLTVLAYQVAGVVLPYDHEDMQNWIIRLKLLICAHMQKTEVNLQDYFGKFIEYEFPVCGNHWKHLAVMFGKPIHVIFEQPTTVLTQNTFTPGRHSVRSIKQDHFNILEQPGHCHYVAIVKIFYCKLQPNAYSDF